MSISIVISEQSKYRVLSENLPWLELAEIANRFRSKKVNINNGRTLNLRMHLGAYIAQSMNGWTDLMTEEMVKFHAGIRVLCGIEDSVESLDRTSIEAFRNMIGPQGAEELNQEIVRSAAKQGFTGANLCASDTTVQEAPIAYPTEVGHLKNISEKLFGIGKKIKGEVAKKLSQLAQVTKDLFTEIRLFTRGKKAQAIEKKKKLSLELQGNVKKMLSELLKVKGKINAKTQEQMKSYRGMLTQINQWLRTGFHPPNKIISLWLKEARAITRDKAAKATEFGRRWIINRLERGYVIGSECQKLGGDADTAIADEALMDFLNTFGQVPETFVYDRGGDGQDNHDLLKNMGVKNDCIFPKGAEKMKVSKKVFAMARTERAQTEASIASIKHNKYGFNKPRSRSMASCITKGQLAMFGFNTQHLYMDFARSGKVALEMT